jgi:hypothetical protein
LPGVLRPGGGSDVDIRAIALHLERHLPGNPILKEATTLSPAVRDWPGSHLKMRHDVTL